MNKLIRVSLLFIFIFVVLLTVNLLKQTTFIKNRAQSSEQVYFGAYLEDFSQISSFEQNAGKGVSLYMIFHAWNAGGFPQDRLNQIRNHGSIPVVSWESYDPDNADATSWQNIAGGSMDNYIRQWAQESKNWGHPYFLRFDWEMNGYWQPYAKQSEWYVPMWKHVHDIFKETGTANATWVWCPNIDGYATMPFDNLYPGNDYVDWVCMDGYNFGTSASWGSWESFSAVFTPTYNHLLRLAPGKPIMIAEIGSAEVGGSKADWINKMLTNDLPQKFPNIKAFIWFNLNKETDWRIESSDSSKIAFAQGIASGYYVSNHFSTFETSPIPYPGSLSGRSVADEPVVAPTATLIPLPTNTLVPTKVQLSPTPVIKNCTEGINCGKPKNSNLTIIRISAFAVIVVLFIFLILRKKSINKKK